MNIWTNRQTDGKIEFTCIWGSLRLAPNTSDKTSYKIYYYKGIVPQTNILCQYLKQGHNLTTKVSKKLLIEVVLLFRLSEAFQKFCDF